MSVKTDKAKILEALKFYAQFLKMVSENQFTQTPSQGGWSYSEVYSHILSANFLSAVAIEKCLNKTADVKVKDIDWRVKIILFIGRFPPVKYKVPPVLEASVKKINKEEASNQLVKLIKKIEFIDIDFDKFNPNYKVKHPRLGYLHAKAWLRFILIHTQHHQKQIGRIEKQLTASN